MQPITDALLDQLQDELRELARDLRSEERTLIEDDDIQAVRELAVMLEDVSIERPLLSRFAFLLRKHATRHGAIAELTGGEVVS